MSLDTGATVSIISKRVVDENKFKILPSDTRIKTADNSVSTVLGVTEKMEVDINGHTCNMEFLIIDHEDHDVLLGLDWFNLTGAAIYPAEGILKFPSLKLKLKKIEDNIEEDYQKVMVTELIDEDDIAEEVT